MPEMWEDFVSEIAAAPGTGAVTLTGANPDIACMTFLTAGYATGDWVYYVITDGAAGGKSEQCMGQFNASAGTLSRAATLKTNAGNTTPLNFMTTVKVFAYPPASRIAYYDNMLTLRPLGNVAIPNISGYFGKDSGGTDRLLLQMSSDNYVNTSVAGGAGKKWRVLNQAQSAELFGVDNSGNGNLAGGLTLSGSLLIPNNVSMQAKDTGGTYHPIMLLDSSNFTTHFVAGGPGTAWRVVNQSFTTTLFSVDNSGTTTMKGAVADAVFSNSTVAATTSIAAGQGYITKAGKSGAFGINDYNIWYDGLVPYLYIDDVNFGQISFVSDRRIKHSISNNVAGALSRIMSLRPVEYRFSDIGIFKDDGKVRLGFIADEVEAIVPSAVNGDADSTLPDGTPQPQSLNAIPILAELTSAVQELKAIVDAQAARIAALENA